jgi:ribosomal protein S18 acetylase RimI-like enzyme
VTVKASLNHVTDASHEDRPGVRTKMPTISLYSGSREPLAPLFSEADDSESEIARYINLGEVLVASEEGKIVGHVQIVDTQESGIFELKSIAVSAERRSRGIGAALVSASLARCRDHNAQLVLVATAAASVGALKFYQRQGFRMRRIIRDFYVPERGYRALEVNGIPLIDEVILDIVP